MTMIAAAQWIAGKMMDDPTGREKLEVGRNMTKNEQWKWLTDAFAQPFGGWKPAHWAYVYQLYELWFTGKLAVTRLPVDCEPYSDRQRKANQAALNALKLIDGPRFSATVDEDQDLSPYGDGSFTWANEIRLGGFIPGDEPQEAWAWADPIGPKFAVPLEIGYTDAVTTYVHLYEDSGVARWAYGSNEVVLIVTADLVRGMVKYDDPSVRWTPGQLRRPMFEFSDVE